MNCGQAEKRQPIRTGYGKMTLRIRNGQSFVQYALLIMVVAAGLIAITTYIMRASNARVKRSMVELNYYKSD